jgi:hypothetical protein
MYLSISDLNPYMPVIGEYNTALLESKINVYSSQLEESTNNKFVSSPNSEYVLHNQRTTMISFPAFQDNSNLKFFLSGVELKEDEYTKIKPKFDVTVQGVKQPKPVTRIKLKNTSFKEHFEFKITGDQSWCDGLPDDLYFVLLETLANDIKYDTLINPKNEFRLNSLNIQSEKVGTRYISYTANTRGRDVTDVLNYGINAPKYNNTISKYRNESTNYNNSLAKNECETLLNVDFNFYPYNTF